ncbi:MAG: hypothetical protein AAFN80_07525 [Pseudomonadota bacterium]
MSFLAVTLVLSILVPLILHIRRAKPAWMFASVAAVFLLLGGGYFALWKIAPGFAASVTLPSSGSDRAYHDTYYVVANFGLVFAFGYVPLIIAALLALQARLNVLTFPSLTRWLFWPSMALYYTPLGTSVYLERHMARRYVEYDESIRRLELIAGTSALISGVAIAILAALFSWGMVEWFRRRRGV